MMSEHPSNSVETRLCIGNLSSITTQSDIESVFKKFGAIKNVWVSSNSQGAGYGFVEYENPSHGVIAAKCMDGG